MRVINAWRLNVELNINKTARTRIRLAGFRYNMIAVTRITKFL